MSSLRCRIFVIFKMANFSYWIQKHIQSWQHWKCLCSVQETVWKFSDIGCEQIVTPSKHTHWHCYVNILKNKILTTFSRQVPHTDRQTNCVIDKSCTLSIMVLTIFDFVSKKFFSQLFFARQSSLWIISHLSVYLCCIEEWKSGCLCCQMCDCNR